MSIFTMESRTDYPLLYSVGILIAQEDAKFASGISFVPAFHVRCGALGRFAPRLVVVGARPGAAR